MECNRDSFSCTKKPCYCKLASEVKAYIDVAIPDGYRNYTVFDLTGRSQDNTVVWPVDQALSVKDDICKYCWNTTFASINKMKMDGVSLSSKSVIKHRYKRGSGVVIYSDSNSSSGKTFVASILMREIISQRFSDPSFTNHTYQWISFSELKDALINSREKLSESLLLEYEVADWLVVDDISLNDVISSAEARAFTTSKIDPFFSRRLRNLKPTILIFRFNPIDSRVDLEKLFGLSIDKMVLSKNMLKIKI